MFVLNDNILFYNKEEAVICSSIYNQIEGVFNIRINTCRENTVQSAVLDSRIESVAATDELITHFSMDDIFGQ